MEVKWTEHALFALEDVFQYGSRFSQELSIEYTTTLIDFCENFSQFPLKYPACEELPHPENKYRSAVFEKQYRIIYKVETEENSLFILDIFHTSRSPDQIRRLRDRDEPAS